MCTLRLSMLFFLISLVCCTRQKQSITTGNESNSIPGDTLIQNGHVSNIGQGALLLTKFNTLEDLEEIVQIQYAEDKTDSVDAQVILIYRAENGNVTSILKSGISQSDFSKAKNGSLLDKIRLGIKCPYAVFNRNNLKSVESLGRRRPWEFGKGDVAFYDLAETMVNHIADEDIAGMPAEDLSEKGYLNTFNHITAQAFMTSIYSERLADFIADLHELYNMPELITGKFTKEQLEDLETGPVDNYIDMINNEWGQELGKLLRGKYTIRRSTYWTPELLADYLNDIQSYHSWAFQIGFVPFRATDDKVIQFANKINKVKQQT